MFYKSFTGRSATSYWTPGDADIAALEERLAAYLQTIIAPHSPDLPQKSANYNRQYIGFVRDTQQLIYANFMCDTFDESSWKTGPIMVMDGGDCYFHVVYNPARQTFSDLQINGEA